MMDIKNILKDFSRLAEARKNHTFRTRLVFIFCAATIAMVLFFSYRVVNSAMDKILVVNEGGELLRFKAMQQDLLYESLLKNHCYHTAYYLNVSIRPRACFSPSYNKVKSQTKHVWLLTLL